MHEVGAIDYALRRVRTARRGDRYVTSVRVERAPGEKCERCWNYSVRVGEFNRYPTVCERCIAALAEIEVEGGAA